MLSRFSRVRLLATPWTAAYQAPPSVRFSRQEYWSGVPLPSPEHALEDGILEERTPDSQAELWVLEGKSEVHGRQILFETRFHEFRRG